MSDALQKITAILRGQKPELRREYFIRRLGIFGSTVRGDATPQSDVDVLVEFEKPIGLFDFVRLEEDLSTLLGKKVDLVTKNALKPMIKGEILRETVYV